jgi:Na+-transporting NADH:ubiquinone oxidoreductase subunit F
MKLLTLRKLHKWVALFVGIQVLLWTVSGATFAWLDHHQVQGEHLTSEPVLRPLPRAEALAEPVEWVDPLATSHIRELSLVSLDGRWLYRIEHDQGVELRHANDGARFEVGDPTVRRLAADRYRGDGRLAKVVFHPEETLESRGFGPTWQVLFDDENGTSLYFSAADGALVATRTDAWRVFDFFWMLHTMDYRGRDDFNHPLVVLAASAALWVVITGVYLMARVYRWLG